MSNARWRRRGEVMMSERLSVNVNQQTARQTRELMARKDLSATEVVRRAIGTYKHLSDAMDINGAEVRVVNRDGSTTLVTFL